MLFVLVALAAAHQPVTAQETAEPCEDVRYLMARDSTPYDFLGAGGVLSPDVPNDVPFGRDVYAHFYAMRVERGLDRFGNRINANFVLTFSSLTPGLSLEFALFRGMEQVSPFQAVTDGSSNISLSRDGVYTLILRRVNIRDVEVEGLVTVRASYPGDTEVNVPNLPDASTRLLLVDPPVLQSGLTLIPMPSAQVRLHSGGAISTASLDGRGTQIRFETGAVTVGNWAQEIGLLGGDLAASGQTTEGQPRLFYLEDFAYQRELVNENLNIEDASGTRINTDWQNIKGLWLLNDCIGVEMLDGRTFTAPTLPEARQVSFTGGLDAFTALLNSPNAAGALTAYDLTFEWNGVAQDAEVALSGGVLTLPLIGDNVLSLDSVDMTMTRRAAETLEPTTPLDITLFDRDLTLTLDWANFNSFAVIGDNVSIEFTDIRTDFAPTLSRSAAGLQRIDARQDVIQIVYQDREQGGVTIPGEQRLLLSAAEGFIEIVTPEGFPTFDSTALPDEPGYAPRALNNLGGECYAVNTTLPEANCPPNGDVNPANGNLWYGVTDLRAHGGYGLDLTLTRSYNSRASGVDGPFGFGWSTEYLLDYNVRFDRAQGSRPVTPETVATYRVGLDVTYAPRGIVTFTTPSGSRHVFASDAPTYTSGELRALTMPGWTLSRENLRANWVLTQTDGFEYQFDRAGRVVQYGYPQHDRIVTIEYPRSSINGVVGLEPAAIAISDDFTQRQIELYYDPFYRIEKSILRDNTRSEPFALCDLTENCFETRYRYDSGGLLTRVVYPGGAEATYTYDEQRHLIAHNDPRAPLAPEMLYTYDGESLNRIEVLQNGEPTLWRQILAPRQIDGTRQVTVIDHLNRRRTYSYAQVENAPLRVVGSAFTLMSVTSPFSSVTEAGSDALTQSYTWNNGLLTQIGARVLQDRVGRNSTSFRYNPDGTLQNISGGFLDFDLAADPVTGDAGVIRFADDTALTYVYGENGRPFSVTDRLGVTYQFTWNERGRLASRVRLLDSRTWTYSHNETGLVTDITTGTHTTVYEWDGIGRLIRVDDPLLGVYTIEYRACDGESCPAGYTDMTVIDPLGVQTLSRMDEQGRLVEMQQRSRSSPSLRHTRYEYDVFDRLTTETVYALEAQFTENPDDTDVLLTTRYSYAPVERLESADGDSQLIYGYSITRQDAYGRREIYTYDAFDRIRQVEDALRRVTRYDYSSSGQVYANGFQITGRDLRGAQVIATTTYLFDLAGQLREVARQTAGNAITWRFITEGDPVKPRYMEATGADIVALTWGEYPGMLPNSVELNPVSLPLQSEFQQPTLRYDTVYDVLGRVIQTTDGEGRQMNYAYCPLPDGGYQTRQSEQTPLTCEEGEITGLTSYDFHGRMIERADGSAGTQRFTYTRDEAAQEWVVEVVYSEGFHWQMRYNAAGDLVYWRDDAGIVRRYTHDGAGRLIRVETEESPEASFTFEYNAANLLTRQVDDLGRGFVYQYDERGLMLVRQDALTADATTFAYGPYGQMTSSISPLGNTTAFRYDDPNDPTRLTGIIDPTGVLETFQWDEDADTLTFSDVRGGQTRYYFDALGALWQIQDAAGQFHEFHYDSAGRLTELLTAQPSDGDAARTLTITPSGREILVSEASQPDWRWIFSFNTAGLLNSLTTPAGGSMTFNYDEMGRLESGEGGIGWTLTREPGRVRLDLTRASGETLSEIYSYDSLYRLTGVTDAEGTGSFYDYGAGESGNTTLTTRNNGEGERTYTFSPGNDSAQPRTVTINAPGQTLTYVYNAEGLIEEFRRDTCIAEDVDSCVPGQGTLWTTSVRFRYDAQGRPVVIVDEEQNVETFAYDDLGNLIAYQTANGKTFNYTYDNLNRLLAVNSPTGIKVLLRYDALNNVTGICRTRAEAPNEFSACEQNNRVLETYTYDSLGRLTAQTFPNQTASGSTTIRQIYTQGLLTDWGIGDSSVQRVYTPDALSLLEQVFVDAFVFNFAYDAKLRLEEVGAYAYAYDAYGRVSAIEQEGDLFRVDYGRGYTLTDVQNDRYVAYGLDERGFLSALDYGLAGNPNAIPLLNIRYRLNPREPNVLSVVMSSSDETRTLDLQLNRQGETRNLVMNYGDRRLLVDYLIDPVGLVTRQRIDGSPAALFAEGAGGYIIVPGYDDDNRPTTLRITDKSGGRLLYVLNFTYESGQRRNETRSYADGTQMTIQYEYATANQLTRRIVEIVPPLTAQGLPAVAAAALMLPVVLAGWRRRTLQVLVSLRVYLLVALSLTGAVQLYSQVEAQQQTRSYTFDYRYDSAGNIREVIDADRGVSCRTYLYDEANHLESMQIGNETIRLYRTDLYNHLIRADEVSLRYAGQQPFAGEQNNTPLYYGREAVRPPFWIAAGDSLIWQMPNGRDRVLAVVDDATIEPVRLLDPLGRSVALRLPFDPSAEDFDPCVLNEDAGGTQSLMPQPEFSGMVYGYGLYFSADGRAYDPVIGRFLQRDPQGPDVLGILYDLGQPQPVPAQRRPASTIAGGLAAYHDAVALSASVQTLDASAVAQRYYPQVAQAHDWTEALFAPAETSAQLASLLTLPARLQDAYNLPGAQIDPITGAISLNTDGAPGQGGAMLSTQTVADSFAMSSTMTLLRDLVETLRVPYLFPPISYRSRLWVPDSQAELSDLWQQVEPEVGLAYTPGIVLEWLPRPLSAPENALEMLRLEERLASLPEMTGRDWFESMVYGSLPQLPELPPRSVEEWRARWFTNDTFGLQQVLTKRLEVPPPPYLPVYGIAYNQDWIYSR
jgi:YD repeat-containing protein